MSGPDNQMFVRVARDYETARITEQTGAKAAGAARGIVPSWAPDGRQVAEQSSAVKSRPVRTPSPAAPSTLRRTNSL